MGDRPVVNLWASPNRFRECIHLEVKEGTQLRPRRRVGRKEKELTRRFPEVVPPWMGDRREHWIPGAGVTGGCGPPDLGIWNSNSKLRSSARVIGTFHL